MAPDVPVVVLSGRDDEVLAVQAVQEGAQDYLVKRRADTHLLARSIRYAIERKRTEKAIARQAFIDPLTSLPNRIRLIESLTTALARVERYGERVAVLFIDLDRFKIINDSLGHEAGDQVLRVVAERLAEHRAPGRHGRSVRRRRVRDPAAIASAATTTSSTLADRIGETLVASRSSSASAAHRRRQHRHRDRRRPQHRAGAS